jgi:serine phosphatase RsbU (regulator of sigma subunit)
MVKVAFTAGIGETHDPGAVLGRMNAALAGMFERAYVTAACAVLRPDEGTLTYALAGHPPPILLSPQHDSVELLDTRGLVLGFLPAVTYTSATVKMEPGARLIIYTDGVTEAPGRDGDLFDLDRLAAFAIAERHRSAEAFADALIESLKRFAHAETLPHDDVTLVVVDVTGA